MSIRLLRAASVAAALSLAALTDTAAQETFTSADPLVTEAGAPETAGTVLKADGALLEANVYEAVRRTNIDWLAMRGNYEQGRSGVVVYVDGKMIGGKEALRRMQVSEVAEIRRLTAVEAAQRFGLDHAAGAILITSK
jgi:hypothetical protein